MRRRLLSAALWTALFLVGLEIATQYRAPAEGATSPKPAATARISPYPAAGTTPLPSTAGSQKTTTSTTTTTSGGTHSGGAAAGGAASKAGAASGAKLSATLVDKEAKAAKQAATVKATVGGIQIVDPATVNEQPKAGQGHLHYQVDGGVIVATTATKLSFHNLSAGDHTIKVMLAGNDHAPLGPEETLTLTVPR